MLKQGVTFETTCQSKEGAKKIEALKKSSKKFSYNKAKTIIAESYPDLYLQLGLTFHNPWSHDTWITKDGTYLHINHSLIDYLFKLNL